MSYLQESNWNKNKALLVFDLSKGGNVLFVCLYVRVDVWSQILSSYVLDKGVWAQMSQIVHAKVEWNGFFFFFCIEGFFCAVLFVKFEWTFFFCFVYVNSCMNYDPCKHDQRSNLINMVFNVLNCQQTYTILHRVWFSVHEWCYSSSKNLHVKPRAQCLIFKGQRK